MAAAFGLDPNYVRDQMPRGAYWRERWRWWHAYQRRHTRPLTQIRV